MKNAQEVIATAMQELGLDFPALLEALEVGSFLAELPEDVRAATFHDPRTFVRFALLCADGAAESQRRATQLQECARAMMLAANDLMSLPPKEG